MGDKTELKNQSRNLDWNKIFNNQVHTIYEPLVDEMNNGLKKVYEKYVINGNEEKIQLIEKNIEKINNLKNEIAKEKINKGITKKRVANGFIIFFCFLIIGLFFLGFYSKNKKIIKEFIVFEAERKLLMNKYIAENSNILLTIFNKFSMLDWKNKVLEELQITKVNGIAKNDLLIFKENKNFFGFNSIQKYRIRDSYYYDVLYTKEYWKTVTTSATGTIVITSKDGPEQQVVVAYHHEPTPFMERKQAISVPTNYKPDLTFNKIEKNLSKKEYDKKIKKGEFLLENYEFYQHYNFEYNDKIAFIDYFKVKTQENFIQYSKYFNGETYLFGKKNQNIYVAKDYSDRLLPYSSVYNWLGHLVNLSDVVSVDRVYNYLMAPIIVNALRPVFKEITQAYLNTNIASEVYNPNAKYLSNYVYSLHKEKSEPDLSIYDIANKALSGQFLSLKTYEPQKEIGMFVKGHVFNKEKNDVRAIISLSMFSYWKLKLYDHVFTRGITIAVPFERFKFFSENKYIFYSSKYKTKKNGAKILFNASNYSKWDVEINSILLEDYEQKQELETIFDEFRNHRIIEDCKILVDNDGLFIFINEEINKPKINKLFELL
ncbi:hypothetical protein [Metamycoplasma alkalescens]|uniref:Uncharacterized protein n=2 Tax=Metamycoplasma alkalescens TaxID=45363 RepID=A0A318U636_9BACT|nr:hypothetical protein [Metamycoplasma alkalescens]PYF43725.1 hypothetical protein BCF88_10143 [Metamycoplasma alkalescens]